jgi:Metalloenzyme superfamily
MFSSLLQPISKYLFTSTIVIVSCQSQQGVERRMERKRSPYGCAGLGITLGMEWIQVPGTTGSYDSPFHLKAEAICDALTRTENPFNFGFVHVKAVDDCGHDRLWRLRVRYLEVMDRMVGQILRLLHEAEQVRAESKVSCSTFLCGENARNRGRCLVQYGVQLGFGYTPWRYVYIFLNSTTTNRSW